MLNEILQYSLWNNTLKNYFLFIFIFLGLLIIFKIFEKIIIKIFKKTAKKTKIEVDDIVIDFLSGIKFPFYIFISLYIASRYILLPLIINKILYYILIIIIVFYSARGIIKIIDHFVNKEIIKRTTKDTIENTSMINVLGYIVKVAIWIIALLMVLSNLGIEITPLIAGLGVGGIAIALALQTILGDLFSAFAIYFDKPFKEGDFIIIGKDMGVVKKIGIKTTRIQTLQGQELVISNSELTNSRINNYKKMDERRILFAFGVEYSTSLKKLKKINNIIKDIFKNVKNARLDRIHFKEFGDFSLNYEVVYYVKSPDYNTYMDIQQEINFKIKEAFEKEKINFAFPTQTIFLDK